MNSPLIVGIMSLCMTFMISILEYQHYHKLTAQALIISCQDAALLEAQHLYEKEYLKAQSQIKSRPSKISSDRRY